MRTERFRENRLEINFFSRDSKPPHSWFVWERYCADGRRQGALPFDRFFIMPETGLYDGKRLLFRQKLINDYFLVFKRLIIFEKMAQFGEQIRWQILHITDVAHAGVLLRHGDDFFIRFTAVNHLHDTDSF